MTALDFESEEATLPGIGPASERHRMLPLKDLDWDDAEERVFRREDDGSITPVSSNMRLRTMQTAEGTNDELRSPSASEAEAGALAERSGAEKKERIWELFFRWYDLWIGAYWDRGNRVLYMCPIPMFGVRVTVPAGWFLNLIKKLKKERLNEV